MRVSFVCYSRGAPQGSKRALGPGRMIESSKRVKPFRKELAAAAMDTPLPKGWPMDAPMRVSYRFHFQRPKSHLTSKGALVKDAPEEATSRSIGDIEKLARAVSDALSGILFNDDSQVVEMHLAKAYDSFDMVVVTVEPIV